MEGISCRCKYMMTLFPHLLHGLQPYLEGDELLSQHQQMSYEKEVSVQNAAGSTHTVRPHLQSNYTKLDTDDTTRQRETGEGLILEGDNVYPSIPDVTCVVEVRGREELEGGGVPASGKVFENDHVYYAVELRQQRECVLQGRIPGLGHILHEQHLR